MTWETIRKSTAPRVAPNLADYDRARLGFTWAQARAALAGLPGGGGLNMAYEAVDRHLAAGQGGHAALRCVARDGSVSTVTYAELARRTARFANVLNSLGIGHGDRVFTLLGRGPELFTAVLGTLKNTSVVCPLCSALDSGQVARQLRTGAAKVLVTSAELYRRNVAGHRDALPGLAHVLIVGPGAEELPGTLSFDARMADASDRFITPPTAPEDAALLHFTSGTSGPPKGVTHVHGAVVAHDATAATALDLHPEDVYWCTTDPGWVTGMSYGVIAPLARGVTVVVEEGVEGNDVDEGGVDHEEADEVRRWYRILDEERVSVWYTVPTVLRRLMRAAPRQGPYALPDGDELPGGEEPTAGEGLAGSGGLSDAHVAPDAYDLSALRFIASAGEPLNPDVVVWSRDVLGLPVHDNWSQTETGCIMIANLASADIRPGSMGRPLPGVEAAVLGRGDDGRARPADGRVMVLENPDTEGELALRRGWPSMFRGYLHDEERYAAAFADGWYLTGDLVRRDKDGWYWFVGRAEDVITSDGHLIGPFEVESALLGHPSVAEAGVIGRPDPVTGESVKAFVSLGPGVEPTPALERELLAFARRRLGPAMAPREITFEPHLPRTRSGKILRRLLRARELGQPADDPSDQEGSG
ncbi:AMP-binding protein [Streptomyces halobius]|uniref:acetate--CoA ligase n=1 Tax=Streptomyces halobius TaxID=2879846 RepID=A0ABY4LZT3_9ACTN|nr:AMP-binding protein [Streptomyces halobius]UQA90953.1 AMP-binding protein [Streptomyces halobius]